MDFTPYIPLLRRLTEINVNFGYKISAVAEDTTAFEDIFQCLEDGTIDPGDRTEIAERIMQIMRGLPEYDELLEFYRENRRPFMSLLAEVSKLGDDEFIGYADLLRKFSIELAIERIFDIFKEKGMIEDKR